MHKKDFFETAAVIGKFEQRELLYSAADMVASLYWVFKDQRLWEARDLLLEIREEIKDKED